MSEYIETETAKYVFIIVPHFLGHLLRCEDDEKHGCVTDKVCTVELGYDEELDKKEWYPNEWRSPVRVLPFTIHLLTDRKNARE